MILEINDRVEIINSWDALNYCMENKSIEKKDIYKILKFHKHTGMIISIYSKNLYCIELDWRNNKENKLKNKFKIKLSDKYLKHYQY